MTTAAAAALVLPSTRRAAAPDEAAVVGVETSARDWTEYVSSRDGATAYHEWQWRGVFKAAFGYESIYFSARRHGQIVGVLPTVLLDSWLFGRALISLPFVN